MNTHGATVKRGGGRTFRKVRSRLGTRQTSPPNAGGSRRAGTNVLGCPFRFYCRAAHSAANGDRSGATTAPTLCLAAPLAAARPTRIQRPRRRHRRDAARYDHSRPRPASLPLSSATLPATPLSGSTAARPVRSGGGRRSVMRCGREGREDCAPGSTCGESKPERAAAGLCPCVSTIVCSCSARGVTCITYWRGLQCAAWHLGLRG